MSAPSRKDAAASQHRRRGVARAGAGTFVRSQQSAVAVHGAVVHARLALHGLILEAAYFRALQRGFEPGHELEDWLTAEAEVMARVERSGLVSDIGAQE